VREFFDDLNGLQEVIGEFCGEVCWVFLYFTFGVALRSAFSSVCIQIKDRGALVAHAFPRMEGRGPVFLALAFLPLQAVWQ
jgi:hypothetical protein